MTREQDPGPIEGGRASAEGGGYLRLKRNAVLDRSHAAARRRAGSTRSQDSAARRVSPRRRALDLGSRAVARGADRPQRPPHWDEERVLALEARERRDHLAASGVLVNRRRAEWESSGTRSNSTVTRPSSERIPVSPQRQRIGIKGEPCADLRGRPWAFPAACRRGLEADSLARRLRACSLRTWRAQARLEALPAVGTQSRSSRHRRS